MANPEKVKAWAALADGIQRQYLSELYQNEYLGSTNGPGYVYILVARNGLTKIGSTCDLVSRFKRHHRKWRGDYEFLAIWIVESQDRGRLEYYLLNRYAQKRKGKGDWFQLSFDEICGLITEFPSRYPDLNLLGGAL